MVEQIQDFKEESQLDMIIEPISLEKKKKKNKNL